MKRTSISRPRERKPYVVDSGGVKSFYAVCPECDNPIQLIGLLRRQQDSLPHRPYGRHIGHDVPGVAVYDEDAYLSCPFSDPGYWRTDRKRKPSNPTGQALYRIMRDRFDRVEYAWRESSGLLLGIKSLRRALTVWRNDKGWLNYGSTYHNLPQMLFFGLPPGNPVWAMRVEELAARFPFGRRGRNILGAFGILRFVPTDQDLAFR